MNKTIMWGRHIHRPIQGKRVSDKVGRETRTVLWSMCMWERKEILSRIMQDKRRVTSTEVGGLGLEWRLLAWKQE